MRISTITNWAYGVTIVLTALSGASFIMSVRSAVDERIAVEKHLTLDSLAEELALAAEIRSDDARLYVMRGQERHLLAFQQEEEAERRHEAVADRLILGGLPAAEAAALIKIKASAEEVDEIEVKAVEAYKLGDKVSAQAMLFGSEHERLQTELLDTVSHLRDLIAARTGAELDAARGRSNWWSFAAKIMLGLTGALFLAVLYFVLRRRVAMPLIRMTGIVGRLAKQDYTVEVPTDSRHDEIGEMSNAIEILRANGIERDRLDAERRADQHTKDLILQMMHRLQGCQNQSELAEIVGRFAPQIFPNIAGSLYVLNQSKTVLDRATEWLGPYHSPDSFPASECWGLRRGRPHASGLTDGDVPCQHIEGDGTAALCVPLTAQGDMIGLIYLVEGEEAANQLEQSRLYLELIAENVGLAIANLQLREKLTSLAIRDPLTGLFNRRHLDETLQRWSDGHGSDPLTCLMIDIDYFKRFNDEYGHDAGDMVMQYVGRTLREIAGENGIACRYGGEEFTVLLPRQSEDEGETLSENLRRAISGLTLAHAGRALGTVTVSLGIASSPHGGPVETLMSRADAALLHAKADGRNRAVAASKIDMRPASSDA